MTIHRAGTHLANSDSFGIGDLVLARGTPGRVLQKLWQFMYGAGPLYGMCHTKNSYSQRNFFLPLIEQKHHHRLEQKPIHTFSTHNTAHHNSQESLFNYIVFGNFSTH